MAQQPGSLGTNMIQIQGPEEAESHGGSEEECVFKDEFLDCYHYADNDRYLVAEIHADFETSNKTGKKKSQVTQEYHHIGSHSLDDSLE